MDDDSISNWLQEHPSLARILDDKSVGFVFVECSGNWHFSKLGRVRTGTALPSEATAKFHGLLSGADQGSWGDWSCRIFQGAQGPSLLIERRPSASDDRLSPEIRRRLQRCVAQPGNGVIVGPPGSGKSALLLWLCEQVTEGPVLVVSECAPDRDDGAVFTHLFPPVDLVSARSLDRLLRLSPSVFWDRLDQHADLRAFLVSGSSSRRWCTVDSDAADEVDRILDTLRQDGIQVDCVVELGCSIIGRSEVKNVRFFEDGQLHDADEPEREERSAPLASQETDAGMEILMVTHHETHDDQAAPVEIVEERAILDDADVLEEREIVVDLSELSDDDLVGGSVVDALSSPQRLDFPTQDDSNEDVPGADDEEGSAWTSSGSIRKTTEVAAVFAESAYVAEEESPSVEASRIDNQIVPDAEPPVSVHSEPDVHRSTDVDGLADDPTGRLSIEVPAHLLELIPDGDESVDARIEEEVSRSLLITPTPATLGDEVSAERTVSASFDIAQILDSRQVQDSSLGVSQLRTEKLSVAESGEVLIQRSESNRDGVDEVPQSEVTSQFLPAAHAPPKSSENELTNSETHYINELIRGLEVAPVDYDRTQEQSLTDESVEVQPGDDFAAVIGQDVVVQATYLEEASSVTEVETRAEMFDSSTVGDSKYKTEVSLDPYYNEDDGSDPTEEVKVSNLLLKKSSRNRKP